MSDATRPYTVHYYDHRGGRCAETVEALYAEQAVQVVRSRAGRAWGVLKSVETKGGTLTDFDKGRLLYGGGEE